MKQLPILLGALLLFTSVLLAWAAPSTARALPEYAEQTSEPCFSCHLSPSGSGPRGARGQAWVALDKPGAIPDLITSLELLGVQLSVDPAYFTEASLEIHEAAALDIAPTESEKLFHWLSQYDGN
jgi:hypothetical protein